MLETYFIYYSVVIVGCIFASKNNDNKRKISIGCICLLVLYSLAIGFKYSLGDDFQGYLAHYQRVYDGNEFEMYFEEGFLLINRFFAFLRVPPVFFFVIINLINIIAVVNISNKILSKALPWTFMVFFMMDYGMSLSTNIYRQYLSISFISLSLPFALLQNKYKVLYIVLCFCAAQVHSSAYLSIIYLFLVDKKFVSTKNRMFWIIFIGLLYIFGSYLMPLFLGVMKTISNVIGYGDRTYLGDSSYQKELGSGLGALLKYLQAAVAIWYYPIIREKLINYRLFDLCFNGFFIGCLLKPFFFTNIVVLRILGAFLYFEYIIVGYAIWYSIKSQNSINVFIGYLLLLTYVVLFYSYISTSINWMSPYIPFPDFYG